MTDTPPVPDQDDQGTEDNQYEPTEPVEPVEPGQDSDDDRPSRMRGIGCLLAVGALVGATYVADRAGLDWPQNWAPKWTWVIPIVGYEDRPGLLFDDKIDSYHVTYSEHKGKSILTIEKENGIKYEFIDEDGKLIETGRKRAPNFNGKLENVVTSGTMRGGASADGKYDRNDVESANGRNSTKYGIALGEFFENADDTYRVGKKLVRSYIQKESLDRINDLTDELKTYLEDLNDVEQDNQRNVAPADSKAGN